MTLPATVDLDRVFGSDSIGNTPEERARTSKATFVRSQSQLAPWSDGATGLEVAARSALDLVGFEGLLQAVTDGATVINPSLDEPARTLREQRERLDLTPPNVAAFVDITVAQLEQAETAGAITPVRILSRLGQVLGLDDERLSAVPSAGADKELAVRLRTLRSSPTARLSPTLVLKLAEAAWIIARERQLSKFLGVDNGLLDQFTPDNNYGQPAWKRGFELAERTRDLLGIGASEPILSVRKVIEKLHIPLVQAELGRSFAGATVENGRERGIVVNVEGDNEKVWVRRMTMCHELGHLLWDPSHRLQRLHVDRYADLERQSSEPVEARANAFAIAFLAPPSAVVEIIRRHSTTALMLSELMDRYGIAATAAKYHLANVAFAWGTRIDTSRVRNDLLPSTSDEWQASENWTVDFFPVAKVPVSRRGRFSGLVASAAIREIITKDQAASYLLASKEELGSHLNEIAELTAADLA